MLLSGSHSLAKQAVSQDAIPTLPNIVSLVVAPNPTLSPDIHHDQPLTE